MIGISGAGIACRDLAVHTPRNRPTITLLIPPNMIPTPITQSAPIVIPITFETRHNLTFQASGITGQGIARLGWKFYLVSADWRAEGGFAVGGDAVVAEVDAAVQAAGFGVAAEGGERRALGFGAYFSCALVAWSLDTLHTTDIKSSITSFTSRSYSILKIFYTIRPQPQKFNTFRANSPLAPDTALPVSHSSVSSRIPSPQAFT